MPTLDWLSRDAAFRMAEAMPTRVLRPHDAGHVYGEPGDSGNLLIQGDNLQALKALLPFYRSSVKCIFIDPPLRRQPGAQPVAEHDAAAAAVAARAAERGRVDLGDHRRQRGALPQGGHG